jgi:iron(III) transport system permease protein
VLRRILLPIVLPAAAAITALNFNSMLDDYDTAIFLAHPLYQPLGLVIKANTDGAEGVDGVSNTFVYTVLLMVITGVTMYLVYGRAGRKSAKTARAGAGDTGSTTPALVEAAPSESVRVP